MNEKRNTFEKFVSFVTGKGFYFVVLLCVAAIALSGFYLVRNVRSTLNESDDQPVGGSAAIVSPTPAVSARPSPTPVATPSPAPSASPAPSVSPTPTPSVKPSQTPAPSASPAALVFTWPVKGTVISDFSVEALAYDATMGDWRTHSGLDISASVGTQVKAVAAGVVSTIYEDDLLGTTVVIDHNGELTSVYSNLTEVPTVRSGDRVSTGTVIGAVGRTAAGESSQEPHLHLAMYKDNLAVNPRDYLPQ